MTLELILLRPPHSDPFHFGFASFEGEWEVCPPLLQKVPSQPVF